MTQTSFNPNNKSQVDKQIVDGLGTLISKIFDDVKTSIGDIKKLEEILNGRALQRNDLKQRAKPEDSTEEMIITPLVDFLGFKKNLTYFRRTGSESKTSRKECDYTLLANKNKVLVESEALGRNLFSKGVGVDQVQDYLERKSFNAEIGIATNGLLWILVRYNNEKYKVDVIKRVDLTPLFKAYMGIGTLENTEDTLREFYVSFSERYIVATAKAEEQKFSIAKMEVSKRFYDQYIEYVFGVNKKGQKSYSLIDAIEPSSTDVDIKKTFAVTLMNRLIFIKFLEDKALPRNNLLNDLIDEYSKIKSQIPNPSFYNLFLKPLFYQVFNTSISKRDDNIRNSKFFGDLPYLNSGLFRDSVPNEIALSVKDDLIIRIIEELLVGYTFNISPNGSKRVQESEFNLLDPDILGYVFEKTINFLTGEGKDNKRKLEGAYYTPDRITNYMSEKAISFVLLDKVRMGLREADWKEEEISKYETLSDFLIDPPKHPKAVRSIIEQIDTLKVLDPACGSGHFLTSALKLITYVRKTLQSTIDQVVDVYELKRRTVVLNLYGVDIEAPAVEIAKLRLWLSLIEEVDRENINGIKTLPNIEYNVILGDSLLGWNNETLKQMKFDNLQDPELIGLFKGLEFAYLENIKGSSLLDKARNLLITDVPSMDNIRQAYFHLKELYLSEQGERAVKIKEILEMIRSKIYGLVDPIFWGNEIEIHRKDIGKNFVMKMKNPIHWSIDFVEAVLGGGFDVVIGNPPYGFKFDEMSKRYFKSKYKSSMDNGNSAMMFIERGLSLTKKGGFFCFIVPKSLAYSQKWGPGRKFISSDLISATDVSKAFQEVKLEQMIVSILKGANTDHYEAEVIDMPEISSISKDILLSTDTIILGLTERELRIMKKMISSKKYFRDISHTNRGFPLQSRVRDVETEYPIMRGEDIYQYGYRESTTFIDPLDVKDYADEMKRQSDKLKIVSQRIVAHVKKPRPHIIIMSAIDRTGKATLDTVENTYLTSSDYSPEFIVALLNSEIIAWYTYRFIFSNAIRTMDLDNYYIGKIPLPSNKRVIKEIENFLANNVPKTENPEDASYVTNSWKQIKLEIERLVGKAYGLDDKEISYLMTNVILPTS